jgi:hypothetical protein
MISLKRGPNAPFKVSSQSKNRPTCRASGSEYPFPVNASIREVEELLNKCDDLLSTESSIAPDVLKLRFEIRRILGLVAIARIRAEVQKPNEEISHPVFRTNWSLVEKSQVTEALLKEFPQLSISTLLAAVEACDRQVTSEEGIARLLSCTREYLVKSMGVAESPS